MTRHPDLSRNAQIDDDHPLVTKSTELFNEYKLFPLCNRTSCADIYIESFVEVQSLYLEIVSAMAERVLSALLSLQG